MRVLGVDPGTAVTGFGVIDGRPGALQYVAAGTIHANPRLSGPNRLKLIYESLVEIIETHSPAVMSLERNFAAINIQSAFRLGEARAIAALAAAQNGLALFEYAPAAAKLAVAGYGRADKSNVKFMVRRTLAIDDNVEIADDAADALALAICHLSQPVVEPAAPVKARPGRLPRRAHLR